MCHEVLGLKHFLDSSEGKNSVDFTGLLAVEEEMWVSFNLGNEQWEIKYIRTLISFLATKNNKHKNQISEIC